MSSWVVAAVAALALALVLYGWREPGGLTRRAPLIVLRALALALVIALLLDAPAGAERPVVPLVALDASASWIRGNDSAAWRTALRQARSVRHDSLYLFGDSVRTGDIPERPGDLASRARPVIERALAAGRPLTIVTDGELDDPAELPALPTGSRIEVISRTPTADLAVIALDAPRAAVGGDTVELRATVRAAEEAPSARLTFTLDGRPLATIPIDPLPPRGERTVSARVPLATADGAHVVAATLAEGGAEVRNDTLATAIEVARAARAVLVSTRPDMDARFMTTVLRGAISLPTRAYLRVAPDEWRLEGPLTPISEEDVRRAVRDAPLLVLHGDTAHFGAPRSVSSGALALVPNVRDTAGEWYPVAAPASPISSALSGLAWDSLPPLVASSGVPRGEWEGLIVARARQFDRRPAITGVERPRRVVTVAAAGFWRWRFRGGSSADAYDALWGSIFDWLAAQRADARAAVPADAIVREGDRVRWLRGTAGDSTVSVVLRRRGDTARSDSVTIRFGSSATVAESEPMTAGVYDVSVAGGTALLVVNGPRELLPRAPTVRSGAVGRGAVTGERPRLRDSGWPLLIALLALCAEWLLRRRSGLR